MVTRWRAGAWFDSHTWVRRRSWGNTNMRLARSVSIKVCMSKEYGHRITYLPYSIHLVKKSMSKVIQKPEVLNLRCINVCQYNKYYLKYWSQGINSPLDPREGQNFQCFIKSEGLLHLWGVYKRVQNIDFLNKIDLSTSIDPPKVKQTFSLYKTLKILTPSRV